MKNIVISLTFTLLLFYFCVPSLCAQDDVTGTLTPKFDENYLPQATPTHTFDFDVDIDLPPPCGILHDKGCPHRCLQL